MSREALNESLSALMDSEANELEVRRVLAALEDDKLRATWSRYQLVRAVMHKELLEPRLDMAAAISAALADEPVETLNPSVGPTVDKVALAGRWRGIGRLAVAASVTVAVLAGVRLYNQDDAAGAQMADQGKQAPLVMPHVPSQAQVASYPQPVVEPQAASSAQPADEQSTPVPLQQPAPQPIR